ncbi:MAG: ATPase [Hyphomonadaceae bacterium]|nr:ATPase [Hyphomonadaceae bacterium]
MTKGADVAKRVDGRGLAGRPRFYKAVTVAPASPSREREAGAFRLLLDGKGVRTPAGKAMLVPTQALAQAIAAEWEAQADRIDPATMPLTRLANSAIDGVMGREADVRADIVKYAGSDLVCYRAESPPELVRLQSQAWDPVLAWVQAALGADLRVAQGIMPAPQPGSATARIAGAVEARRSAFDLAALHVMTTLTGSAVLALAHAHGRLGVEEAWRAAHVDEDWQISQWGEDAEAKARRERRWLDMQAAGRLLALVA